MPNLYDVNVAPYKYIYGCVPSADVNGIVKISPGQVRDDTNSYNMLIPEPWYINPLGVELGGGPHIDFSLPLVLDTGGSLVPSRTYTVFVVGDSSGSRPPRPLLSLSQDTPRMPIVNGVTYSLKRKVGYVSTNSNEPESSFSYCNVIGNGPLRKVMYSNMDPDITVLSANLADEQVTPVPLLGRVPNANVADQISPVASMIFTCSGFLDATLFISTMMDITGTKLFCTIPQTGLIEGVFGQYDMIPGYLEDTGAPYVFVMVNTTGLSSLVTASVLGYTYEV